MSEPQENRRGTLLEWVKDSGLLTVTILGLLIYALFAIPTGFFYYLLGVSLAEVGITYTSLLSGSVLGLMLIVLALVYVLTFLYYMYFMYRSAKLIIMPAKAVKKEVSAARNKYPRKKDWQLDDEDFDERLRWLKARYSRTPVRDDSLRLGWEEFESNLRRRRELRKKANLTSDESFELQCIEYQIARYRSRASGSVMGAWVKRYRVALCMAYFLALGVITALAGLSATDVQSGGSAGTLSKAFGYQADRVTVCPASTADEKKYQWLAGKKVYLLGETAQSAVLYLPYTNDLPYTSETIQVPIAAVIISSSTSPTSNCNGSTTSS